MARRQTWSLPWAADEAPDAILLYYWVLVFFWWVPPWAELHNVTTIRLLSPFSSPVSCEYFSADTQSVFTGVSSAFHHAGRNEPLGISVNRIGMFPHHFIMKCDGVPLSCNANLIWASLGISMKKHVVFFFVRDFFTTLTLARKREPERSLCNRCTEVVN